MTNRDVYVLGAGTTAFGRFPELTHRALARTAIEAARADAGEGAQPEAAWVGSCTLPAWGQANLGGHVLLAEQSDLLPADVPIFNVEAACATGSLAFHSACTSIRAGDVDVALALGVDKTFVPDDPLKTVGIFLNALDLLEPERWQTRYAEVAAAAGLEFAPHPRRVIVLDIVALSARWHMREHGTTREQLAHVAAKNAAHGALNVNAQRQSSDLDAAAILAEKLVCEPFSKSMCAPIGDGASALILCSGDHLETLSDEQQERAVRVVISQLTRGSRWTLDAPSSVVSLAQRVYERAGITPDQIDVAEVHDATAFAEIALYESLGFCAPGEGGAYAESGAAALGGARPVNPSGGLQAKGHPLAATGLAQIGELTRQLRGEAGGRQVEGARLALQHNGGGLAGFDEATSVITILSSARLR